MADVVNGNASFADNKVGGIAHLGSHPGYNDFIASKLNAILNNEILTNTEKWALDDED